MKRLLLVLLVLAAGACSTDSNKDNDTGPVGDVIAPDTLPEVTSDDGVMPDGAPQEVFGDATVPQDSTPMDIVETEGTFELFSTAPKGDLNGIWGAASNLYAVGDNGVILRRQGTTWSPMKSATSKDLLAVFGSNDEDIYAAGAEGTLLHWDGVAWEMVDTGLELDLSALNLNGVWGADGQFYVVGDKGTVLHFFEGKWKADESLSSYNLGDVWGVSLTDIYAGAAGGTVLRKIGGAWNSQQVTQGGVTINGLQALSAKAIYGGGTSGSIIAHDSAGWSPKLSNDAYERTIRDVWAFAEDDVWMVGDDGALIHLEATKWNTRDIAGPFYKNHSFYGLWGRSESGTEEAWAVGEKGAILYFDGNEWVDRPSLAAVDFNDLDGDSWETVLAVGQDGALLRFDGTDWFGLARVTDATLNGVATKGDTTVVVGTKGTVLTVAGDLPSLVATDFTNDLFGVCSGAVFAAVGAQGKVFTSADGTAWEPIASGIFDALHDCAIDDSGIIWAVGDMGKILRIDGSAVTVMPVATIANLHRITIAPDNRVYVVGDNGLLLAYDGSDWTKAYEEPGLFLYGVAAFEGVVYAVGWAGRILAYNPKNQSVTPLAVPESGVLLQIWGTDADHLLVVGKKGKMLRYVAK